MVIRNIIDSIVLFIHVFIRRMFILKGLNNRLNNNRPMGTGGVSTRAEAAGGGAAGAGGGA